MKSKEELKSLRKLTPKDLHKKLDEEYLKLHQYKFSTKFRNQKDINMTKKTKRYIARIYTILVEKLKSEDK